MAKRQYTQREARLLGEFLAAMYPHAIVRTNVKLGPNPVSFGTATPAGVAEGALSAYMEYVDAIVFTPDRVIMVEAAIDGDVIKPAKLEKYKWLWTKTAGYAPYKALPLELLCVAASFRTGTREIWEPRGIRFVIYTPAWLTAEHVAPFANVQ